MIASSSAESRSVGRVVAEWVLCHRRLCLSATILLAVALSSPAKVWAQPSAPRGPIREPKGLTPPRLPQSVARYPRQPLGCGGSIVLGTAAGGVVGFVLPFVLVFPALYYMDSPRGLKRLVTVTGTAGAVVGGTAAAQSAACH